MAVRIDKGSALDSLSLTPLIDIVFLLLIFFLVATKFAEEERELAVMLPEASEAQPLSITVRSQMPTVISSVGQESTKIRPKLVATPLPPRKRSQGDQSWPTTARPANQRGNPQRRAR